MHSQFWRFWTQIEIHPETQIDSWCLYWPRGGSGCGETAIVEKVSFSTMVSLSGRIRMLVNAIRLPKGLISSCPVIGPVEIGENAKVGAAAVVVADVLVMWGCQYSARLSECMGKDEPTINEVEKREYVNKLEQARKPVWVVWFVSLL